MYKYGEECKKRTRNEEDEAEDDEEEDEVENDEEGEEKLEGRSEDNFVRLLEFTSVSSFRVLFLHSSLYLYNARNTAQSFS